MKVLGMTQYKTAERFLFPTTNKSMRVLNNTTTTPHINQGRIPEESCGFFKAIDEIFSPVFKGISKIFG